MNFFARLLLSLFHGSKSPLVRPDLAHLYQQNTTPPKQVINVTPSRKFWHR